MATKNKIDIARSMANALDPALELSVSSQDKEVLRGLAGELAAYAAQPEQAIKRKSWYAHNALEPGSPMIFCDPENSWHEIIPGDQLHCTEKLARQWEWHLRVELFWAASMGDDRVVEPTFPLPYVLKSYQGWGVLNTFQKGGRQGSFVWDAPIQEYERDLPKLTVPSFEVDHETTAQLDALANGCFGDLLQVQRKASWWWSLGLTNTAIFLRGLNQFLLDICMEPENLKRLMAFLSEATLSTLDDLEAKRLLCLNNTGSYVGSGGFGYTTELPRPGFDGHVTTRDLWGFCESQETSAVSPEQFEEFVFPYQKPIMDRFGLTCYGCCEPLHLRWHIVKRFNNLRRISVAPWADLEAMADALQDNYIFSLKPNPAPLATANPDFDAIRKHLREALTITRSCRVEIIMKDTHTIGNNPENVIRWCKIAREEVERIGI